MLNENESYENLENLSNFDVSLECKSDLILVEVIVKSHLNLIIKNF